MQKGGMTYRPGDQEFLPAWDFGAYMIVGNRPSDERKSYSLHVSSRKANQKECWCLQDTGSAWCHCQHSKTLLTGASLRDCLLYLHIGGSGAAAASGGGFDAFNPHIN